MLVALVLAGGLVWAPAAGAVERPQAAEPDYTKGEVLQGGRGGEFFNYWALGPTGAFGNIWAARTAYGQMTQNTRMIQIRSVTPGTPADGVLEEGDVIVGVISPRVDGKSDPQARFEGDARKALSAAVTEAEKRENGGRLVLNVWRKGERRSATLLLPVLGSFSATSPWGCDKTRAVVDAACQDIIAKGLFETNGRREGQVKRGIPSLLDALGLLATGEEKYLPLIEKYARAVAGMEIRDEGLTTWNWSYTMLFLTEYYLATGDQTVWPAIREYADRLVRGQSTVGTWGHGMALPGGVEPGYGAMNQCSLTCGIALILARKCGLTDERVGRAVDRTAAFMRWFVDKGTIPYGDHSPNCKDTHDDNGKNSQAAVMFNLLGDKEATEYFTRMTLASYHNREAGHTGHFFGWLWGALGAACGGEEAAQSFIRSTRWFTELERRPGGGSVYQFQLANYDHGKYTHWSTTGSRLLQHCLPRRKLYITGRGGSCIAPITTDRLKEVVAAAEFDPEKRSTRELLLALGSWSPVVRHQAAAALGDRDENVVSDLMAMLNSPNRYARYGACAGLKRAGRGSGVAVEALTAALKDSRDLTLRYYAMLALRLPDAQKVGGGRNVLAAGNATHKAVPDLLTLAARPEPDRDPMQKLQYELAETLFYEGNVGGHRGYFPGGKGLENLDRGLLIPAVKSLLKNPNGRARTLVSSVYDNLTAEDLESLWGDIDQATRVQAPSGAMFATGVRTNGLKLMARHHVAEGIERGIDIVIRQKGWGDIGRKSGGFPALMSYGRALERYFPELEEVIQSYQNQGGERKKLAAEWAKLLRQARQTKAPDLISIRPYLGNGEKEAAEDPGR